MHRIYVKHPVGQGQVAGRFTCLYIFLNKAGDFAPARLLPYFKRPLFPAKAPADCHIDIAGIIGNLFKQVSTVMPDIAMNRPKKLCMRVIDSTQIGKAVGVSEIFNDLFNLARNFNFAFAIRAVFRLKHQNFLAFLFVNTNLCFCTQRAAIHQRIQPFRNLK